MLIGLKKFTVTSSNFLYCYWLPSMLILTKLKNWKKKNEWMNTLDFGKTKVCMD